MNSVSELATTVADDPSLF